MDADDILVCGSELSADILAVWRPFWRFHPGIDEVWPEVAIAPRNTHCFICDAGLSRKTSLLACKTAAYSCVDLDVCLSRRDDKVRENNRRRFRALVDQVRLPDRARIERARKGMSQ